MTQRARSMPKVGDIIALDKHIRYRVTKMTWVVDKETLGYEVALKLAPIVHG